MLSGRTPRRRTLTKCHTHSMLTHCTRTHPTQVGHILVKKADALDAVALVMSSHNKGRVAEFFLGSCTQ